MLADIPGWTEPVTSGTMPDIPRDSRSTDVTRPEPNLRIRGPASLPPVAREAGPRQIVDQRGAIEVGLDRAPRAAVKAAQQALVSSGGVVR